MRQIFEGMKHPNLKELRVLYKEHRLKVVLFIFFTILSGIVLLAIPFTSAQVITAMMDQHDYNYMIRQAALLFILVVISIAAARTAQYFYLKITNQIFFEIRKKIAIKAMSMNLASIYDKGSGFFTERLNEDSREASGVTLNGWRVIINLTINISFVGYIAMVDIYLGLLFTGGIIVLMYLEYRRVSKMLENKKISKRAIEKVKATEIELLNGMKEIKGLNAMKKAIDKHDAVSSYYTEVKYSREMYQQKMQSLIDGTKGAIELMIFLFAGLYLLPHGLIEEAMVLVIFNLRGNIYGFISNLAMIKDTYANGELAAKRVNDVIKMPLGEVDKFGDRHLSRGIETIEFRNVRFHYHEDDPVLKNVSFNIDGPQVIGFVGKSGSGKSTIFSLLARFYEPTGGNILLNGTDISELAEEDVRGNITPVLQDPYIFNDTIMNNLLFAAPEATEEEVFEACRKAQIHDEITDMPGGYDTIIGENGATISGGQKQRLEIARVLLKDSKVMLFDEATSALDRNNLERINDLVIELSKNKIILVIAHRLAIMRRCDRVVVLNEGEIIATGTHSELIATCQYYRELFNQNTGTRGQNL